MFHNACASLFLSLIPAQKVRFPMKIKLHRLGPFQQPLQLQILHPLVFIAGPVAAQRLRAQHNRVKGVVEGDNPGIT